MKKLFRIFAFALAMLLMVSSFAACKKEDEEEAVSLASGHARQPNRGEPGSMGVLSSS